MTTVATATAGREVRAITLIGFGHFLSHFYMFGLAPLFRPIHDELGVTYTALGAILTAFNVATAVLQTPMGMLVDRFGARRVLIGGLFTTAAAFALSGLTGSYWGLLVLFLVAGAGNSVFHPADYVILTASVDDHRHGKAYSLHSFGGALGTAAGPAGMAVLLTVTDWRSALVIAGVIGVLLSLVFVFSGDTLREDAKRKGKGQSKLPLRSIVSRAVILLFMFYALTSAANIAMTGFAAVFLPELYGVTVENASYLLSVLLFSTAAGTLFGGWLADRTQRHDLVLVLAFSLYGALLLLVGTAAIPVAMVAIAFLVGGFARGIVNPSRDIMVREVAPAGALGTVFAFVSTGFNVGQGIGPLAYGAILDHAMPHAVVYLSAFFMFLSIGLLFFSRDRRL